MYSVRNIGKFLDNTKLPKEEQVAIIKRAEEKANNNIISFSDIDYVLGNKVEQFRQHMLTDENQLELTRQDLKKFLR